LSRPNTVDQLRHAVQAARATFVARFCRCGRVTPTRGERGASSVTHKRATARVIVRSDDVYVEGVLPIDSCTAEQLADLCLEVGVSADELGSMIAAVHVGSTWFSDDDSACQCGGNG